MKRMKFKECIKKGTLRETGVPDKDEAEGLLKLVKHREKFWKVIEKDYAKEYPSLFLEGHYEIVKELLTAIMCLDGWKAINHECIFAYIKENYENKLEMDIDFLLLLKDIRNDIDYRGAMIGPEKWEKNKLRIKTEIKVLKDYLKKRIDNL